MRWPWQREEKPASTQETAPAPFPAIPAPKQELMVPTPKSEVPPLALEDDSIVELTPVVVQDKGGGYHRLPERAQHLIAEMLGQYRTTKQILEEVHRQTGQLIAKQSLTEYRQSPKWKPTIEAARIAYNKRLSSIPLANKATRLERLEGLYNKAITENKPELALKHLARAGEEMEEVKVENIYVHQNILNLSTEQLAQRQRELIEKLSMKKEVLEHDAVSET